MRSWCALRVGILGVAVLAVGVLTGAMPRPARADGVKVDQSVRDRILRDGHARVLVSLRLPSGVTPEGLLPSASHVAQQRSHIASQQSQVRARLQGLWHHVGHAYQTVPLLALDVGANALARLEASSQLVSHVREDGLLGPALPQSVPLVEGDQAWAAGFDGKGTVVAIVDSGVDGTHPFLAGKVVEEACFSSTVLDSNGLERSTTMCPNGQSQQIGPGAGAPCPLAGECWHGTHVAGIAAGNGDQAGQTFSGVAKGAQIMALQVFSQFNEDSDCGAGNSPCISAWESDIIAGLEQVYNLRGQHNFGAVNMSLAGGFFPSPCDDRPEKPAIDNLRSVGIASVISSGNRGSTDSLGLPACISSAVSVGSTDKSDVISSFSNVASFLSLLAPGGPSIFSSVPGGGYNYAWGTSMAAPHVAGAFAVLREAVPSTTVDDILTALEQTGMPITDTRSGGTVTKPRIQILQALQALVQAPALISLSPNDATAGDPGFTLTVNGSGFFPSSVVQWNSTGRSTIYVNSEQLTATISAGDIGASGTATVTVLNPGGTSNGLQFTIVPAYTLTVTFGGTGSGTVTSSPAGINCGATCSASYPSGTAVTLQATPAAGSVFTGWGGACAGTGPCNVAMNAATAVTATFSALYTLTVTPGGTGSGTVTSSPAGINCGATCSASYPSGTAVTLQATPAAGSTFVGWGGSCSGTGACNVTLNAATAVTATFNTRFTLTLTKAGTGSGTVTSSPGGINCGPDCSQSYPGGTVVTLTAKPKGRSTFTRWTGACSGTGTCTVTMTSNLPVGATFSQ